MKRIKNEKGMMTVEACMVLPLFMMLLLFFNGLIIMFSGQQMISHALLQSSNSLSMDAYANDIIGENDFTSSKNLVNKIYASVAASTPSPKYFTSDQKWYLDGDKIKKEARNRFIGYFSGGDEDYVKDMLDTIGVVGGLDGITFEGEVDGNNDLKITVKYKQKFLFDINGLVTFDRKINIVTHMWHKE